MENISRRQFAQLILGGLAGSWLAGCATDERKPDVFATPAPGSTVGAGSATPGPVRTILENKNVPGFYVRYYKRFEAVDSARWKLTIEGLVQKPASLTLPDLQSLAAVSQVSRLKCVECWSAAAKWDGFRAQTLFALVQPKSEAKWVQFHCADDYYESLSIEELLSDRALFVHHMNDDLLPDEHGAPLRIIFPSKYGYKGPKAITRVVFARDELPGYWPTVGDYTKSGDILEGTDHPLDLPFAGPIKGGEVIYPEGLEGR